MSLVPMGKRILTQRVEVEDEDALIIIPDQYKERAELVEVIAMGKAVDQSKVDFAVGDIIFIGSYAGTEIENNGETYLLITEDMAMARTDLTRAHVVKSDESSVFHPAESEV